MPAAEYGRKCAIAVRQDDAARAQSWRDMLRKLQLIADDRRALQNEFDSAYRKESQGA